MGEHTSGDAEGLSLEEQERLRRLDLNDTLSGDDFGIWLEPAPLDIVIERIPETEA